MTDDELDLLASAYVDGEATPDEVAMVERDPELQARVEIFRSVEMDEETAAVPPPAGLVDQHLAAALAEFEAIGGSGDGAGDGVESTDDADRTAPVVDLRDVSARRADRATRSETAATSAGSGARASRSNSRPARTMPSWLPAAAGFVIVGGGFLWAVNQTGGGDDDTETASLAIDDTADEIEADAAEESGEDGDAAAMSAMSDEAMEESDDGDDAMEEDAMAADEAEEEDRAAGAADSDAAAPADDEGDDESAEDAEAEPVELEPLLFFDEVPDVDTIVDLPEPETDIERSLCGPEIITTALGEFVGFIPVVVQGQPAEIYLFLDGDGAEIRRLIDERCQSIEP